MDVAAADTAHAVPVVRYLALDSPEPHLVAQVCEGCGARYLGRRNGCGRCSGTSFTSQPAPTRGTVQAFTVVWRSMPGVPTPFVSVLIDLGDGLIAKGNLVDVDPAEVDSSVLGTDVRLVTNPLERDGSGALAVGFAFSPLTTHER